MALFQTALAQGRAPSPIGYVSGCVMVAISTHTFTSAFTAATDKIELGLLPAGARPVRVQVLGEGVGDITADVGFMSGDPGQNDNARTVGDELIDGVSVNDAVAAAPLADVLAITPTETHRAIGAVLSGNVAAGASKRLTLVLEYTY
jgi:hypothetical protein